MQNNSKSFFRIKPLTKYDFRPYVEPGKRKWILETAIKTHPKLDCRGGTALSNPYKEEYDLIIAEKKANIEIYTQSKLWSPRMTPTRFKWAFVFPMGFAVLLVLYLHYVQIPKRMLHFKRQKGFIFPELEGKGWLEGWIEEDYIDDIYDDEVLQEFSHFAKEEEPVHIEEHHEELRVIQSKNHHAKMENQLLKFAQKRAEKGIPVFQNEKSQS